MSRIQGLYIHVMALWRENHFKNNFNMFYIKVHLFKNSLCANVQTGVYSFVNSNYGCLSLIQILCTSDEPIPKTPFFIPTTQEPLTNGSWTRSFVFLFLPRGHAIKLTQYWSNTGEILQLWINIDSMLKLCWYTSGYAVESPKNVVISFFSSWFVVPGSWLVRDPFLVFD